MKPVKVLFFIAGVVATAEEQQEAATLTGAQVMFRNASAVPAEKHSLEICDGVAGEVPELYAEAFPSAEDAIKARAAELKALAAKVGDGPAPKKGGKKVEAQQPQNPQGGTQTPPAGGAAWTPNQ